MNTYHILYTTSKKYFPHMMTSIYSLLENNKELAFTINIVETDFSDKNKKILDELIAFYPKCNIVYYDVVDLDVLTELYSLPKWRGSDISNAKLFASEIVENAEKILYLDSDTLIVDNIKPLLDRKSSYPICAVMESKVPSRMKGLLDNYYNSGVLLFDCEHLNNEDSSAQIFDAVRKSEERILYPAQDILNLSLQTRMGSLELGYNISPFINDLAKHPVFLKQFCKENPSFYSKEEILEAVNHPHILHHQAYLNSRVWDDNRIHPFRDIYKEYRNQWDDSFQIDKSASGLTKLPFLPYLNMTINYLFPDKMCKEIKNNVKKKVK